MLHTSSTQWVASTWVKLALVMGKEWPTKKMPNSGGATSAPAGAPSITGVGLPAAGLLGCVRTRLLLGSPVAAPSAGAAAVQDSADGDAANAEVAAEPSLAVLLLHAMIAGGRYYSTVELPQHLYAAADLIRGTRL